MLLKSTLTLIYLPLSPSDPPIPRERYLYAYSLLAGLTPLEFLITYASLALYPFITQLEFLGLSLFQADQNPEIINSSSRSRPTESKGLLVNLLFCDSTSILGYLNSLFCRCSSWCSCERVTDPLPNSVLPGKTSIPPGSLWAVRVWLRVNGIDHRLFGEDDVWVGKDLDFNTISEASFARLKTVDAKSQLYHGFVGRALLTFTMR